jgi:uncharacterized protein (TIGR03083 family)
MTDPLATLQASSARLRGLVAGLDAGQLEAPAYPSEWSIAQVLSHLGSAAVIGRRSLDDGLAGTDTPEDFAPSTWDAWNAKTPAQQANDGLAADRSLVERYGALTDEERARVQVSSGPMQLDFETAVTFRLNEHVLHTWDVAVALDPTATLPDDGTEAVIDNLDLIGRYGGRTTGSGRTIEVATTDPKRGFTIELGADRVTFTPGEPSDAPDLVLPAEAFIRLVYGRLDPVHTPAFEGDEAALDELRKAFPGV